MFVTGLLHTASTCRKNTQLESELNEARQRLSSAMVGSIALTSPEESLRQLQEENQQLKQQLSRSMTSLISSSKVSRFVSRLTVYSLSTCPLIHAGGYYGINKISQFEVSLI